MSAFICPFCGVQGKRTKEHVWAQWLHETDGAKALLAGSHGERIPRERVALVKNSEGRYQRSPLSLGKYAKWLPHVTVYVCAECNGGWMSQLESDVKELLWRFYARHETLRLSIEDLQLLATWATKSWMAYALTNAPTSNPFTETEYRQMASSPAPLDRGWVWLMHTHHDGAHVSMGLTSTLMSFAGEVPDLAGAADNAAFALLGASSVVLTMMLLPPEVDADKYELLAPEALSGRGVRRIWPEPRRQYFPLDDAASSFTGFYHFADQFFGLIGLPVEGLTDDEALQVTREFMAGADPADLRARWAPVEPPEAS